jgi:hypothetical protein
VATLTSHRGGSADDRQSPKLGNATVAIEYRFCIDT